MSVTSVSVSAVSRLDVRGRRMRTGSKIQKSEHDSRRRMSMATTYPSLSVVNSQPCGVQAVGQKVRPINRTPPFTIYEERKSPTQTYTIVRRNRHARTRSDTILTVHSRAKRSPPVATFTWRRYTPARNLKALPPPYGHSPRPVIRCKLNLKRITYVL